MFDKNTRNSNLMPKDKPISQIIAIISDSESDWEYLDLALFEAKSRGATDIVHLGDITKLGVLEDFVVAKDLFIKSGLSVYPVPGDRDLWKSKGLDGFQRIFGKSYQLVDLSNISILLIDNSDEFEGLDPIQVGFVIDSLSDADFVFLHNPIYSESLLLGSKGMGEYSLEVEEQRKVLLNLIRKSNVRAVFAGDQHKFSEVVDAEREALSHYVVGAINSERNLERPNMSILTVYTDGDYYVEKISF